MMAKLSALYTVKLGHVEAFGKFKHQWHPYVIYTGSETNLNLNFHGQVWAVLWLGFYFVTLEGIGGGESV